MRGIPGVFGVDGRQKREQHPGRAACAAPGSRPRCSDVATSPATVWRRHRGPSLLDVPAGRGPARRVFGPHTSGRFTAQPPDTEE